MTEKEFRKLNKRDLLEMLIFQTKRADELQAALDEANIKVESKEITFSTAGSLAEAALKLNGVFEAADEAVASYLEYLGESPQDAVLTGDDAADELIRRQALINEAQAKLAAREAECLRREAACEAREKGITPPEQTTDAALQYSSAPMFANSLYSGASAFNSDTQVLSKQLETRKAELDEREKQVGERELYCTQALEAISLREQNCAEADRLLKERERACEAQDADMVSREKELERFNNDINDYIFALCDRMNKISYDCDEIKQMTKSFSHGTNGIVPQAADNKIPAEENDSL